MKDNSQNEQIKQNANSQNKTEPIENVTQHQPSQEPSQNNAYNKANVNKNPDSTNLPQGNTTENKDLTAINQNQLPQNKSTNLQPINYNHQLPENDAELSNTNKKPIEKNQENATTANPKSNSNTSKSATTTNDTQNSSPKLADFNNKKEKNNYLNPKSATKNPSRNNFNNISRKHSKHAKSENDDDGVENDEEKELKHQNHLSKPTLKDRVLNKTKNNLNSKNDNNKEETEEEQSSGEQITGALGSFIKQKIIILVASNLGVFAIVFLVAIIAVILITANNGGFASEDGQSLCYVATKCQKVIIKNEEEEKSYSLDEFISGAIVNYYKKDLFLNDLLGNKDNIYQALGVIIHSDLVYYSKTDESTETCTITDNNKFKEIYVPSNEISSNMDTSNDDSQINETDDENGNNENDSTSKNETIDNSKYDVDNITNDQINEATSQETRLNQYYEKAKSNFSSVRNMMVIGYSKDSDLYYTGYEEKLYGINAKSTYEEIIKDYLPLDDAMKEDDKQIVYPICNFDKSNSENDTISYSNDICSTVHINSGSTAGDYTIDKFIEGVVYNEAGGWSNSLDTLKAHAVAARTYLVNRGRVENGTCYIDTGTNTMGFTNKTNAAVTQAVTETSGEYIMVNGKISKEAEWDALCITNPNTTGSTYILCQKNQQISKKWIDEDVTLYGTISWYNEHSHGRGMSQYGAYYMATVQNKNYKDIIKYYYDADVGTVITQSKEGFVMPINTFSMITGETTGYCGSGNEHSGMDFAATVGTPIYAAHDGVIVKTYDYSSNCYGSCSSTQGVGIGFRIDNQDGTVSMYMHMSQRMNLSRGTTVKAGQLLGYVGNTGSSTGPHLHYGMLSASTGAVLNPRNYLPLDEKGIGKCYNYK